MIEVKIELEAVQGDRVTALNYRSRGGITGHKWQEGECQAVEVFIKNRNSHRVTYVVKLDNGETISVGKGGIKKLVTGIVE